MEQRKTPRKLLITTLLLLAGYSSHALAFSAWCTNPNSKSSALSACAFGFANYSPFPDWNTQYSPGFNSITDAINYYKEAELQATFPGLDLNKPGVFLFGTLYQGTFGTNVIYNTYANAAIIIPSTAGQANAPDYGVSKVVQLSYEDVNGNTVSRTFSQQVGGTTPVPGESTQSINDQLQNFAKGSDGASFLTGMLQSRVANSAVDPVAGNPVSYMARLVDNDYDLAIEGHQAGETEGGLTLFGVTPSYNNETLAGLNVKSYNLPLRYNHFFNNSNGMIIDMPITMQTLDQSNTYSIGLGGAYSHFFTPIWSLMPALHVGAVGSLDLGSATLIYDGALASRVLVPMGQYSLGMTNDVSYLKTQSITIAQYTIAYKLSNWMTKNGVDANYIINKAYSVGTYYDRVDRLSGSRWYLSDYNEIGVKSSKINLYNGSSYNFLTLGLGYLFGPAKFSGVNMSLGVNF
jgi:hypothetical protein